jgi:hypothetical protein
VQDYLIPISGAELGDALRYGEPGVVYKISLPFQLDTINFNKGKEFLPQNADNVSNALIILTRFFTVKK